MFLLRCYVLVIWVCCCNNAFLLQLLSREIQHERNLILQCVRYTVQNNFFTSNASVEGEKRPHRPNALLQCIRYVVDTKFLSLCQMQTLHRDDTEGSKATGGDEHRNCTVVCKFVNEVNNDCVQESDEEGAKERHVTGC